MQVPQFARPASTLAFVLVIGGAAGLLFGPDAGTAAPAGQGPSRDSTRRYVPDDLQDTTWLQRLRDAQIKAAASVTAFHNFQFADRLAESGISFRHSGLRAQGSRKNT
jgi:hypothetical protein